MAVWSIVNYLELSLDLRLDSELSSNAYHLISNPQASPSELDSCILEPETSTSELKRSSKKLGVPSSEA